MGLPRIIGITGYARHGKDTVAGVLTRELGYNRVALADKMKALMLVLNPLIAYDPIELADGYAEGKRPGIIMPSYSKLSGLVDEFGWEGAKKVPEVRRLLQVFGTEVGREGLGEDVWIGALARGTKGFYGNERKIVIPDVRFINEAQFIRDRMGGEVWRVERPDFDNGLGANSLHASEREIMAIRVDGVFVNTGPKSKFVAEVFRTIKFKMALVQAQEQYRPALDALAER